MKGKELLPDLIRAIREKHRGKRSVSHAEMIRTFSVVVGRDLDAWFAKWYTDK
jgi:hypothetical protein